MLPNEKVGCVRRSKVTKKIRGVSFEENLNNAMGLEFYNLSHRFGYQSPNWPYFEDVKIERIHYMAKSGVLSQRITTSMHNTTHIDAPAHVVQDASPARRGDRQHRLAPPVRGQRRLFLPCAGLRVVGRTLVRREEGQGRG